MHNDKPQVGDEMQVRPFMRTLAWLIALFVNCVIILMYVQSGIYFGLNIVRFDFVVVALFSAICILLVAARTRYLPSWGRTAMKLLCWAVLALWLPVILDYGDVSGIEAYSLIVTVLFGLGAWGSWRAFLLFTPKPNE